MDRRSDRGRVESGQHQAVAEGPEAMREHRTQAPRSSQWDGAGEAQLLQWAPSTPPAGQARGMLRTLARAREIVAPIGYETVRCTLKKRTDVLASGIAWLSNGARGGLREGLDLYGQPYDTRYPGLCRDEPPKPRRAATRTPQPADTPPPTHTHTCGTALRHRLAVRGTAGPVAHRPRRRTAVDWEAVADHPRDR